jgi:hypothetical protein
MEHSPSRSEDNHGSSSTPSSVHDHTPALGPDPSADAPHQHALIVVGREHLFLCHMTSLWWKEHMYHLVLRVNFDKNAAETYSHRRRETDAERARYFEMCCNGHVTPAETDAERRKDRTDLRFPWTFFFMTKPGKDTIPDIKLGVSSGAGSSVVEGNVYRGFPVVGPDEFPWDKEDPIVANVSATIEHVVYYRPFDFNMEYPLSRTYVMFGARDNGPGEAHIQHLQTKPPDFDQVATLQHAPDWVDPHKLEAGVHVNIPSMPVVLPPPCGDPLFRFWHDRRPVTVEYFGRSSSGKPYEIDVERTHWFGTAVANPEGHDPCANAQPHADLPKPGEAPKHADHATHDESPKRSAGARMHHAYAKRR